MRVAPTRHVPRSSPSARRAVLHATLMALLALATLFPGAVLGDEAPATTPADDNLPETVAPLPSAPFLSGRLAWVSADSVDLVADLRGDVPFLVRGAHEWWFDFALRTAIKDTTSNLDFFVRDIDYLGDVGWRVRSADQGPGAFSVFVGQRGKERVDAEGGAFVRYVAAGVESRRFRQPVPGRPGPDLQWQVALGPVIDHRNVDADAYYRGEARFRYGFGSGERPPRSFAFDLRLDGLARGAEFDADVTFGPGIDLPFGAGRRALLFVHYQYSDNPLGLGEDAWLAGVEISEGIPAVGFDATSDPALSGLVGWGGGQDDRYAGQLYMRFESPQFGRRLRVLVDVDANALTAEDIDDIYWSYDIGLERVRRRSAVGVYLFHRSNHHLAQQGAEFTGRNVAEFGCETDSWHDAGRRTTRRGARFDYRLRVGWVINSDFDDDQRWSLRAGFRWSFPIRALGGVVPYLLWDLEEAEVDSKTAAIGVSLNRRLDIQLEHRDDDQLFSRDKTATLLMLRYGFRPAR